MKKQAKQEGSEQYLLTGDSLGDYVAGRVAQLFGGNKTAAAAALGVTRMGLWNIIRGKYRLSPELVAKLNEIDPEFTLEHAHAYWLTKKVAKAKRSKK
jgi:plasmid maintenance system antidote protein VapI